MEIENEQLKFIVYCRKSSESEDRQVLSLQSQKRELAEIAKKEGLHIVKFFSESKSAYKKGRDQFAEMLKMIDSGKANAILTWHLTRLARNSADGGTIIYMMDDGLIKCIRTPDGVYRNTGDEKFMMQIHFAMAKKSSDDTSIFVKRDIQTKLSKGEFPSFAPVGYLNIDKEGKIAGKQYTFKKQELLSSLSRPLKRVEQDVILAPLILKLFESAALGKHTLDHLRNETYSWGLMGGRSKKKLAKQTVYRILTSPFYYGAIPWKGEIIEPEQLPEDKRHEPIITRALFERVQEVLGLRSKPFKAKQYYRYTNMMVCGECNGNLSALTAKGHIYYRCMKCKGVSYIGEEQLEKQIEEEVSKIDIDQDFYNLAIEEINKANEKEIGKRDAVQAHQKLELQRCQTRIDNLIRLKISPDNKDGELLSDKEFAEQKKEVLEQKRLIQEKMIDVDGQNEKWFDSCVAYVDFAKNLADKFKIATPEQKRDIFSFVCYNPVIKDKKLVVSVEKPNKFLMEYNEQKASTITIDSLVNKRQNTSSGVSYSVGRCGCPEL